jgi:hypothetical protein
MDDVSAALTDLEPVQRCVVNQTGSGQFVHRLEPANRLPRFRTHYAIDRAVIVT